MKNDGPESRDNPRLRLSDMAPETLLERVLDTMPSGLFTVDSAGVITSWNRAMEEITGFSAAEALGAPCSILQGESCMHGGSLGSPESCPLFTSGTFSGKRCKLRKKDGTVVTITKHARVMRDADGDVQGAIEAVTDLQGILTLEEEVERLRQEVVGRSGFQRLVGRHPAIQKLYEMIELAGSTNSSVLLLGETGTGKELVAHAIHACGMRRDGPLVRVSFAALSEQLLESELFGHVRGAFTGAVSTRKGRFEAANGGTILLDEIGDISLNVQTKLLRVLQEREFERVGDTRPRKVDIRVIAATNRDLERLCDEDRFRRDLFYRLAVIPIRVPALRERMSDIPLLCDHFIARLNRTLGRSVEGVSPAAMRRLMAHNWPGNVRELEHAIEYAFVVTKGPQIEEFALPANVLGNGDGSRRAPESPQAPPPPRLEEASPTPAGRRARPTRDALMAALEAEGGNRTRAAKRLGVSRVTLWKWLKATEEEVLPNGVVVNLNVKG